MHVMDDLRLVLQAQYDEKRARPKEDCNRGGRQTGSRSGVSCNSDNAYPVNYDAKMTR
jgi:hypothetical protein